MIKEHTPQTLTGIDSVDRERQLDDWDSEIAKKLADRENIDLTDEHLKVLNFLREHYIQNGWPKKTSEMSQLLDDHFEKQGGKKYLYKLFPEGPLAQGTRIAGLPGLAYTENKSFGSVQ